MNATKPRFTKFRGIDLYCGAGGMSTGAEQSGHVRIDLAVNHWRPAIMTHSANHPQTRHICAELEHVDPINDSSLPDADVIMAGVECTHHSNAKGGSPVSDQKRSSARNVLDWLRAKRPKYCIIENVREFRDWGRTRLKRDKDGKKIWDKKHQQWAREADPDHKGEYFQQWISEAESLGYYIEHRLLNSADYGEATKRIRLFVIGRLGGGPIAWPVPTHAEVANGKPQWRGAWEIINWKRRAPSVFGRPKPLAEKTIARIKIGLCKFNAPQTISEALERDGREPFIVKMYGTNHVAAIGNPLPTITGQGNHLYVAQPFVVKYHSGQLAKHWMNAGASVLEPLPTIDTNPRFAVAQPFVYQLIGRGAGRSYSVHDPLPTIVASRENFGVVQPFLFGVDHRSGDGSPHAVTSPLSTVTSKQRHCLAVPFLVPHWNERPGQLPRTHSVHSPLPAVTSRGAGGLATPFLVDPNWQDNRGGRNRRHSVHSPLGTITTCHTPAHLVIPYLIEVNHGEGNRSRGGRVHGVDGPLNTITGKRCHGLILPQPFIVNYYGTGQADSTSEPLSTVTTKHRHGLTLFDEPAQRPAATTRKLIVLDKNEASLLWSLLLFGFDECFFRMLDVDELAKAMGLPDDYFLYGNKAEQIKQVGNAVSVRTMKAICLAIGEHEIQLAEAA